MPETPETLTYRTPSTPDTLAGIAMVSGDDRGGRGSAWRVAGLMFVLCLLMNLPFLTLTPLAGTEGHRSLSGHGMVRSGQWLVPMLCGRPYLAKPPLHYWLIATSESLLRPGGAGVAGPADLFAWRLPSAVNGGILAAVVCLFAWRWFGRAGGWVAGGCAVGMVALWGEHQVADLDSTNNLVSTLAALATVELLFAGPRRPGRWLLGSALAVAATLMTKGPAGFAILAGVWLWAAAAAVYEGEAPPARFAAVLGAAAHRHVALRRLRVGGLAVPAPPGDRHRLGGRE